MGPRNLTASLRAKPFLFRENEMILLVTMSIDPHTDLVVDALREMGAPFFRYNTDLADQYAIEISLDGGILHNRKTNKVVPLETVRSVWVRRRSAPDSLKNVTEGYTQYLEEQWKLFTEILLSVIGDNALWVNHPFSYEVAKNKLHQLRVAREVGLIVPSTCITNNPAILSQLVSQQGKVLYKPVSSSIIDEGRKAIYANLIDAETLPPQTVIDGLTVSPSIFQSYIEKQYELRITVVGSKVFATRIYSQGSAISQIDWRRYDFDHVGHEPTELPKAIEQKCLALLRNLNLHYGAIDMIVTPDNEYVFLEINANGQWAWIEMLTGFPIAKEIATLLASPF